MQRLMKRSSMRMTPHPSRHWSPRSAKASCTLFLPPTEALEHFVDLVARIEAGAAEANCPVVLEGYGPPADARLETLAITPDPGVIEVNVPPTASFAEQCEQLQTLWRAGPAGTAVYRLIRPRRHPQRHRRWQSHHPRWVVARRFADAAPTRPAGITADLLAAAPSLSYLFSGRFIGTTSQAPRVDEGRSESLYELEIAFAEIARLASSDDPRPWVTDRALRHLLTDITGNTHRAEFCIDKLYSPDGSRGRLGLLELRGFEMPPHYQMAMVQSLLVRSLVARFWEEPTADPARLNLHGRYLCRTSSFTTSQTWQPTFVATGSSSIPAGWTRSPSSASRESVQRCSTTWRSNCGGDRAVEHPRRGVHLRGTARYVDSSVERIQVPR